MGEVVNVIVAFAVIVFIVRWATSGKENSPSQPSAASVLGFRPRTVTPEMIETVHAMFPDIPTDNIRYDLLRTGSVQVTTNKLIERGFLSPPPAAYYTVYPRQAGTDTAQAPAAPTPQHATATSSATKSKSETLIERYRLQERVQSATSTGVATTPEQAGGKGVWEDTPEKREANLRERKAQMILAARQRLLAQQKAGQEVSNAGPSSS